jgi:hypothetical protein
MNPPTVVQPDTPDRVRAKLRFGIGAVVLVVATAVALSFIVGLSSGPGTVARLTFENHTAYALDIEVSPGTGTGWTSAGSVRQQSTADVNEVVDQGDVWLFRFDSQGQPGGQLRLTRAELQSSGWRVVVPDEVGTRLAGAGAPPTP